MPVKKVIVSSFSVVPVTGIRWYSRLFSLLDLHLDIQMYSKPVDVLRRRIVRVSTKISVVAYHASVYTSDIADSFQQRKVTCQLRTALFLCLVDTVEETIVRQGMVSNSIFNDPEIT